MSGVPEIGGLNGGIGVDTAVYQDALSNYAISVSTDSHGRVTGFSQVQETGSNKGAVDEGTDTLTGIERLTFQNGTPSTADDVTLDLGKEGGDLGHERGDLAGGRAARRGRRLRRSRERRHCHEREESEHRSFHAAMIPAWGSHGKQWSLQKDHGPGVAPGPVIPRP